MNQQLSVSGSNNNKQQQPSAKDIPPTPSATPQSTTRTVKQCISCNTLSTENEPFCEKCGRKVVDVVVTIPIQNSSSNVNDSTTTTLSDQQQKQQIVSPRSANDSKPLPSLAVTKETKVENLLICFSVQFV
jgi:hypothetical protein